MIDRGERAGLALAAGGHVALLALLSASVLAPKPEALKPVPIEVALVDDVSLESMAPDPATEEPAARLSPVEAPIEPDSAPPEPVEAPRPEPKPQPALAKPAPAAKPQPAPVKPMPAAAAKPIPARAKPDSAAPAAKPATKRAAAPTGRLDGIVAGLTDKPTPSKSTRPPAATAGPAVRSALVAEVLRQIKPRWRPPSGADSDKLRTTVQVSLNRDGTLAGEPRVTQTGVTESNRSQAALHRERAIRAVKLAAPFQLPPQYYDAWKTIAPTLYEGL